MAKLKVDPEFRDKIPALTEAEFDQLRENILSDGEVYEPLVTWNGTIVDGHNRWRIICENWELLKDKFRTKPMEFVDKWAAFEWMFKNQLGRRNLSDEDRTYCIGKMKEARKKSVGGKREMERGDGGRFTASHQNGGVPKGKHDNDTDAIIAKEIGVGRNTVYRAEKFAKGIDAIRDEFPETADRILKGGSGITKEFVASIPSMPEEKKMEAIEAVKSGPEAVAEFKRNATMAECNATPIVHDEAYNERDFAGQVNGFPKEFDDTIRLFLMVHGDMLDDPRCAEAFEKMLSDTEKVIEKYKEVLNEHRS